MENLTIKELRFITEYLFDFNATQAAIRAGYSEKWANKIGPELLQKPVIEMEIAKIKQSIVSQHKVTTDKVIHELFKMAFGDSDENKLTVNDLMDKNKIKNFPGVLNKIKKLSIRKNSIQITFIDRLKAAELLVDLFINMNQYQSRPLKTDGILERIKRHSLCSK